MSIYHKIAIVKKKVSLFQIEFLPVIDQTGNTTVIRRIAIRETSVSQKSCVADWKPSSETRWIIRALSYRGVQGRVFNWAPNMPRDPALRKKYFHFLSNWMGYDCGDSFFFRFWTKWNSNWLKIQMKAVTTIISHSMWNEMEIQFSQCSVWDFPAEVIVAAISQFVVPLIDEQAPGRICEQNRKCVDVVYAVAALAGM